MTVAISERLARVFARGRESASARARLATDRDSTISLWNRAHRTLAGSNSAASLSRAYRGGRGCETETGGLLERRINKTPRERRVAAGNLHNTTAFGRALAVCVRSFVHSLARTHVCTFIGSRETWLHLSAHLQDYPAAGCTRAL